MRNYEIKVVPMINPDGVALGNYRCSYSGHDLNRRWRDTNPSIHAEIHELKRQIDLLDKRVCMVIDIHGHSRKRGVFFYGCSTFKDSTSKEFPYLMEKCYPDVFSFHKSCFKIQPSKEGTLRIYLWKKLKIPLVYTMECSFSGSEANVNYLPSDFERVGRCLIDGLTVFFSRTFEEPIN